MSAFDLAWVDTYLKRAPRVIADVGCYDCEDSLRFKTTWPECRVIAFEACPDNLAQLERRFTNLNRIDGVEVFHYAVCDRSGSTKFWSNRSKFGDTCSGSMLMPNQRLVTGHPHLTFLEPREVPCIALDEFCRAMGVELDVVHMDIQGAEWYALKGLGELRPKLIFVEVCETEHYEGAKSVSDLHTLLTELGYQKKSADVCDELWVLS